jgi:hypothetical protein
MSIMFTPSNVANGFKNSQMRERENPTIQRGCERTLGCERIAVHHLPSFHHFIWVQEISRTPTSRVNISHDVKAHKGKFDSTLPQNQMV